MWFWQWALGGVLAAAPVLLAVVAEPGLSSSTSEAASIEVVVAPDFPLSSVSAADVERLVHMGWHDTIRTLVQKSHVGSEADAVQVTAQVREAVRAERKKLDDLIRALDRNYGTASEVSPASQWAQNSTHVFLSVKFAQRFNAPGALEVENETVLISKCCLNFTAFGEHSFIRKRYHFSWELLRPLLPEASSWSLASVGRLAVTMAKKTVANWPRLHRKAGAVPKNLGVWRDMKDKWKSELAEFPPLEVDLQGAALSAKPSSASASPASQAKGTKGSKSKGKGKGKKERPNEADDAEEEDDALDREVELLSDCKKASYISTSVAELCAKIWAEAVETPRVAGRRWLVKLYSSQGDGNLESMRVLMPVWKRLADVFPSMVAGGRVGALDCSAEKELCRRLGVKTDSLPQVWRFVGGVSEAWTGSLEASIEDLAAFGDVGRSEL